VLVANAPFPPNPELCHTLKAWWGNDRDALEQDETVPITLGKYEAEGDLTGLLIRRMEVFGGITESGDNDGAVAQFDALLFWVFVDVAATKMAAPVYNASVDAWEQAVLRICAEVNSNPMVPLSVYAKVDSSIQAEVEKAVNADMPYVRCAFFDKNLRPRMPLAPTPLLRLKLLHAYD
jgi:hypothetical protein